MIQIEQDIEHVESWDPGGGGKLVPGVYEVKITEVKVEDAKSSEYKKLNIKTTVVAGEHMGGTAFIDRSLHPNALGYFRGMLDLLNCYATGKSFDEQLLVGRYLRVNMATYTKADQTEGLKVDRLFRSEINDDKNEQIDISEGVHTATAGAKGNGKPPARAAAPAPAAARPAARPPAKPPVLAGGGPQPAPPHKDEDLPF